MLARAWRNLWRNGWRTAITLSTVALGTVILILIQSLMEGLVRGAVRNATNLSIGEAQVHAAGYLKERSFYATLENPHRILEAARAHRLEAAPRSYGYGLLAHGTKSAGARFQGIDPVAERRAFELARHVADGDFLDETSRGGLVLGRKLARSLDVAVGDEIVVVVQAADGSLGNDLYTVTGILAGVNDPIDRGAALLHAADFEVLFVSGGRIHEIAFQGRGSLTLPDLKRTIEAIAPGEEVRTWRELLPMLSDMIGLMDRFLWIFASIFFLAAALGVMNTMLMATHERIREFGILKAIGTPPRQIVRDVATEALLLALLGTAAGALVGSALSVWLGAHGIDTVRLAGETSFGGVAFDPVWRPALTPRAVVQSAIALCGASVVATLYPAVLAARLDPVEAIRRT